MRRLVFFVITFFTIFSFGQNRDYIFGQLVDATQNEPISFGSIRVKGAALGVISNIDGTFKIPLRYKTLGEVIEISCMGYKSVEILIQDLLEGQSNIIILRPSTFELKEAVVSANIKRLSAQQIVKIAINSIPQNYPQNNFGLIGYYRDYQVKDAEYFNLNEGVFKVFDNGFYVKNNFENEYQLISYRKNLDFKIDSFAKQPYDYQLNQKVIPGARMENSGGNEFITLLIHDAIRNYQTKTFSFINDMAVDFLQSHHFRLKGKTNFKEHTVYEIECFYRNEDYFSEGKIFISTENFAFFKLDYAVYKREKPGIIDTAINADEKYSNGFNKTKKELIYHIITEYVPGEDEKMFLNYISFYNKILLQRPSEFKSRFILDLKTKRFVVKLNRIPENVDKVKTNDFKIKFKEKLLPLKRVRFFERERCFKITPNYKRKETGSILEYLFTENENLEVSNLSYSYGDIRDSLGNRLDEKKHEYFHQYREFFMQETLPNLVVTVSKDSLMLKDEPLDSRRQPICVEGKSSDYWMNTPLQSFE